MKKALLRIAGIVLAFIMTYSAVWYGYGVYVKKIIMDTMVSSKKYTQSADKIELGGFPFKLVYHFKNLNLDIIDGDNKTVVNLGNPTLKLNLCLSKFALSLNNDIVVTTPDNKQNFIVHLDNGASFVVELNHSSVLSALRFGGDLLLGLNSNDLQHIHYQDMGYTVTDKVLDKVAFVSRHNSYSLDFKHNKSSTEIDVVANFTGEGGTAAPDYLNGMLALDADFSTKFEFKSKEGNAVNMYSGIDGINLDVRKLTFVSQNYNAALQGSINVMNSTQPSTGSLNFQLNFVPNFITALGQFTSERNATYVRGLLYKMAGTDESKNIDQINIDIKSEDRTIKFGNATIVDLMLYSIHG